MRREPSQINRVLRLLEKRGKLGIAPTDFLAPTVDGGKPILRLAARIYDLQHKHGYRITERKNPDRTSTYLLVAVVERSAPPDASPPRVADRGEGVPLDHGLFDATGFEKRHEPIPHWKAA